MRNLFFYLIIILTASMSFSGCRPKDVYNNVPKEYYPVYKEGDTLIYRCGTKYDTFSLDSVSIIDVMHDLGHYQFIDNSILSKNYPYLNQPSACWFTLDFAGITIEWLNCSAVVGYDETPGLPSLIVNNVTYTNVYELDNYSHDTNQYVAKKLYFNFKYWVIRYMKNDSTTWNLVQH